MYTLKNKNEYEELKERSPLLIVQIGSKSCLPCVSIKNKIDLWQKSHPETKSVYIPIEEFPEIAASEGIFSVPSVLLFAENKLTIRESGYFSLEDILFKAERLLNMMI